MADAIHPTELVEINAPVSFLAGPREMWRNFLEYRHLIWNFIQRDIRLKYRDSSLGYFWSLLEPMGLSAVYWVLFVILAGKPQPKFALWVLIGVIVWGFFSTAVSETLTSLTRNEGLIKQVYFPREIFALTNVGSKLILSALSLLVCIPLMVHFRIPPTVHLLMVPLGLLMASMLGLGIGLGTACLNVVNRDVDYFFRFVMRAGFFLSPVMWTVEQAGSRKAILPYLLYNPITVPLTMVRNGIDARPLHIAPHYVIYSVAFCLFTFLIGAAIFKRFESEVVKKL
jgi:lipopolysaccharide transport system permease protein